MRGHNFHGILVTLLFSFQMLSMWDFVLAQNTPTLKFEHITSDQGLSNRMSLTMMKDSKGFLWIGTIDGVNRYDGYEFKIFRNNPYDSTTISKAWPQVMAEDKNGIIWIACTTPQGLNAYNPATGKFKRYSDNRFYKNILPDNTIKFIYPDRNNNLWLSVESKGLLKFNPSTNKSIYFRHDPLDASSLHDDDPLIICPADSDHLYISFQDGFDLFDMRTGKSRHFISGVNKGTNRVNYIFKDSKNKLWLCTYNGLIMFDPLTEKYIEYHYHSDDQLSLSCDSVNWICESPDGRLWITTDGGGLNIFEPRTNKFIHFRHDDNDPSSISSDYPGEIHYDSSGKIWLQTWFAFAIDAVNLLPDKFESFTHNEKDRTSISGNAVSYIFQDKKGHIFICLSEDKGVNIFNPAEKTFEVYQPDPKVNKYFRENTIDYMFEDNQGNYWLAANQEKLILYNPITHHAEIFYYQEKHHPDSLGVGFMYGAYQDAKNIIWFGGAYHLSAFNPATRKFKAYLVNPAMPGTDINQVGRFFDWGDGKMWMPTANGIAYYDQAEDTIIIVHFTKNKAATIISDNSSPGVLVEEKNKLWLGTMGQGLFFLDLLTGNCVNVTSADGLPNDVIWGILKDRKNNLWLATNDGICRFTPSKDFMNFSESAVKGTFRNYNMGDGIPAKEFSWNSSAKMNDGSMLFGLRSAKGLIHFHPDSIKDNTFIPPVYITHFSMFNKEVIPSGTNKFLESTIETTKEITLSYSENVFAFGFTALSFIHPENNKYAYMLEGFDKDWIITDASKRFANYTNLDPGEYIFKVKASNNDGVWNQTPTEIKLIITPPFWKTWWFRILVAGAVAGAVYSLYRNRLNQLMRLQLIRNKIASDLHDDIGSTLSSISIFTELAKKKSKEVSPLLDQIGEHAHKMLDSMADIVWTINPENDNFEKIIIRMRSFAYDLLGAKDIEFEFNAEESTGKLKLPMTVRKNLYLIFKEAANNMAKYSDASRAMFSLSYTDRQLKFLVRDNGIGFDKNKITNGNGLKNMYRRANEIGAEIFIESELGGGTNIELRIAT